MTNSTSDIKSPQKLKPFGSNHPPGQRLFEQLDGFRANPDPALVVARSLMHSGLSVERLRPRAAAHQHGRTADDALAFERMSGSLRSYLAAQELIAHIKYSGNNQVTMGNETHTIAAPRDGAELDAAVMLTAARLTLEGRERAIEIAAQDRYLELMFVLAIGADAPAGTDDAAPRTLELIEAVSWVTAWPLYQAKYRLRVKRPIEVNGSITPLLKTPPHASYPGGHATSAFAIAEVLSTLSGSGPDEPLPKALSGLAARIADNRECAGLHTAADTDAGRALGRALGKWMSSIGETGPTQFPLWSMLYAHASVEWVKLPPGEQR